MKSLRFIIFWSLLAVIFSVLLLRTVSSDSTPKVTLTQYIVNYSKFLYKGYPRGSITGTAQFQHSAKHDNITVSLLGSPYRTVTKIDGHYQFKNIPVGKYILKATYPNYGSFFFQIYVQKDQNFSVIKFLLSQ